MKIAKVKIVIDLDTYDDPFIVSKSKHLLIRGEYFEGCETIEEIRDKFYETFNFKDEVVDYTSIYTYLSDDDYEQDNFHEHIGE